MHINGDTQTAHVQWLEHSSQTVMGEISDSKELFLNDLCDNIPLDTILGKVVVYDCTSNTTTPILSHGEFYYK